MRYQTLPVILFFAVIAIIIYQSSANFSLQPDPLLITAKEARRGRYALILDVRTPKEREHFGFFPESIPIDTSRLAEEVPFLLGQKPGSRSPKLTPILVYSNAGDGRAQHVAEQLYDLGFIGVRYLKGSYLDMLPPGPLDT